MLLGAKKCKQKQASKASAAKQVCSCRAYICPGKFPSAPALGQQTSQQHEKGADASGSLRTVKIHGQAGNCAAGTGNLHGMRSRGARRKLVAGGQRKHDPSETYLKAEG